MILTFEYCEGDNDSFDVDDDDDWHPIFLSPFVKSVIECADDESADVNLPLPEFIQRSAMVQLLNFLYNHALGDKKMGFGKHYDLSYRNVLTHHSDYYYWARRQQDPGNGMKGFLDWVKFYRGGSKPESPELVLPIAKYFQIDSCSGCGVLGPLEGLTSTSMIVELRACRRTGWPRVPVVPDWETVTNNSENKLQAWREAWEQAAKDRNDSGKVVCCSDDQFCRDCIRVRGCQICKVYECKDCQADTDTPKIFQEWHENLPNAEYEDEYGRRGDNPYQTLKIRPCLKCRKRICQGCGQECQECQRIACGSCTEDLNTWCEGCRGIIENNDDSAIGPIDRDEYVCRPCFDRRPMFCGCGEPSYDPEADFSNEDEDSEEDYEEN